MPSMPNDVSPDAALPDARPRHWESEALLVAGKLHLFYYFRNWAIALAPIDVADADRPSPLNAELRQAPEAPE